MQMMLMKENKIMSERKACCSNHSPDSKKNMEILWLRYYNAVLLEKGLITEDMFRKLERQILNRPAGVSKTR